MRIFTVSLLFVAIAFAGEALIPGFSRLASLEGSPWRPLEFRNIKRHSRYSLESVDGTTVVRAETDDSASGLIVRKPLDPEKTPILVWRWRISNIYEQGDAFNRNGDDYPARIYVAFAFEPDRAGVFEKAARAAAGLFYDGDLPGTALNYIWANRLETGRIIPNVYSDETRMIAVDSGAKKAGQWVAHRRNLKEDFRAAFGREAPAIIGIGIMSDSDNTGEKATAWYGDISLLPAEAQ